MLSLPALQVKKTTEDFLVFLKKITNLLCYVVAWCIFTNMAFNIFSKLNDLFLPWFMYTRFIILYSDQV